MAALPLLQRLGSLFQRRSAQQPAQTAPAPSPAAPTEATPSWSAPPTAAPETPAIAQTPVATQASAGEATSTAAVLADPIVAQTNQELAAEQTQAVPTEDEALQAEQHTAWAAYDFERCIVIFSRLLELHPDDPSYKEKLTASYFNRGKQYETQGDERRASQLYYSALSVDPNFTPAQEAAEAFLNRVEGDGTSG